MKVKNVSILCPHCKKYVGIEFHKPINGKRLSKKIKKTFKEYKFNQLPLI